MLNARCDDNGDGDMFWWCYWFIKWSVIYTHSNFFLLKKRRKFGYKTKWMNTQHHYRNGVSISLFLFLRLLFLFNTFALLLFFAGLSTLKLQSYVFFCKHARLTIDLRYQRATHSNTPYHCRLRENICHELPMKSSEFFYLFWCY